MENQDKLLTPFQRKLLLKNLHTDLRPEYHRRIEIMLLADAGQSQAEICKTVGCTPDTARYWIGVAREGNAHHWNDRPMGRPKAINEQYIERLKELVNHSPREYGYSFKRWTAQWLSKHLAKEMDIQVSERHINRLLKDLGLSTRQKHGTTESVPATTKNFGIRISDLQSSSSPSFVWSANLLKTSS
ncbi:MAG TPA: helix-turn-helix domain-containing protein [Allocoleopsis sp.]